MITDRARCTPLLALQNNTTQLIVSYTNGSNVSIPSLCLLSVNHRIGVYSGVVVTAGFLTLTRSFLLSFLCVNASRVLHNEMFGSILRAPIRFFDTNPIGRLSPQNCSPLSDLVLYCLGRVLNRFSKDIGFLDDLLPLFFLQFFVVRYTSPL